MVARRLVCALLTWWFLYYQAPGEKDSHRLGPYIDGRACEAEATAFRSAGFTAVCIPSNP